MKTIESRREEILIDTIDHFQKFERCINKKGVVAYSGDSLFLDTIGCAIGRLLPDTLSKLIDRNYGEVGLQKIWFLIPEEIQELGQEFLIELSCLHDNDKWWFNGKLSEEGLEFYEEILTKFIKQ